MTEYKHPLIKEIIGCLKADVADGFSLAEAVARLNERQMEKIDKQLGTLGGRSPYYQNSFRKDSTTLWTRNLTDAVKLMSAKQEGSN